jgi:hypothetical protein
MPKKAFTLQLVFTTDMKMAVQELQTFPFKGLGPGACADGLIQQRGLSRWDTKALGLPGRARTRSIPRFVVQGDTVAVL